MLAWLENTPTQKLPYFPRRIGQPHAADQPAESLAQPVARDAVIIFLWPAFR